MHFFVDRNLCLLIFIICFLSIRFERDSFLFYMNQ